MITYRIQIETLYYQMYLRKEYLTYPQALKALKMIDFSKYGKTGDYFVRVYQFEDEKRIKLMS